MSIHGVGEAIQPSHPLSSPSPSALNLSQHQGLSLPMYLGLKNIEFFGILWQIGLLRYIILPYFFRCFSRGYPYAEHITVCCFSVAESCLTLCDPMDWNTPAFPVHNRLPELAQPHVHQVSDANQISHPLSFRSSVFNLS